MLLFNFHFVEKLHNHIYFSFPILDRWNTSAPKQVYLDMNDEAMFETYHVFREDFDDTMVIYEYYRTILFKPRLIPYSFIV